MNCLQCLIVDNCSFFIGMKEDSGQCIVDISIEPFNSLCDSDTNPCSKLNTKSCQVGKKGNIECICKDKYMPPTCHHLIDYCTYTSDKKEKPGSYYCGSTGVCVPILGQKRYRCKCDLGYTHDPSIMKPNCAMKSDPCFEVMCLNNGLCYTNGIRALCICPSSWTGEDCSIPNSNWNSWRQWSACFPTCGANSKSTRTRSCRFSRGKPCPGSHIQYRLCYEESCIINGRWGNWSPWTECTHSCNGGRKARYRDCNYDGNFITRKTKLTKCVGSDTEIGFCNEHFCPAKLQGTSIDIESTDGVLPPLEVDIKVDPIRKELTIADYLGESSNEFLLSLIAISFVVLIHFIGLLLIGILIRNIRNLQFNKLFKPDDIREMRLTVDQFKQPEIDVTADFMAQLEQLITQEIEKEEDVPVKDEKNEKSYENSSYFY
ncbi:unnamed protein product [Dimorphilus gyrociliatus]|uniref:EGF-like domain-containing protein n=1 Tax=Dimorphilus gyrociliatus TaxID=2664684 RepID=A0A7I8VXB4_9ANNE|nr:unnamed protein product [Dimorphilus gyrociliatus]